MKLVAGFADRRRRAAKTFSVLILAPQLLSGEALHADEHALVTSCLDQQLRVGDAFRSMGDHSYIVVLRGTTEDVAPLVAHRLTSALVATSASVTRRNWHAGVAHYPRDARTEAALIRIAREELLRRKTAELGLAS